MRESRFDKSRYESLHASRRALARSAPLVRWGLLAVGTAVFLDQVRPLISDAQFTWGERRVMGVVALVVLGGFGLAAWAAGRLLRASAELIEVFIDSAESSARTSHLIETHLVPNLARIANALERRADSDPSPAPSSPGRASAVAAVRRATREARWGQAARLLQELRRDHPTAPEIDRLATELDQARRAEADALRARLDDARRDDDAATVVDCRDALTRHLDGPALHELDRKVAGWLSRAILRRTRNGTLPGEILELAERTVDSLGDTPEGRDIAARLPEYRRRAGCCPRCARPLAGADDACPDCLASPSARQRHDPATP